MKESSPRWLTRWGGRRKRAQNGAAAPHGLPLESTKTRKNVSDIKEMARSKLQHLAYSLPDSMQCSRGTAHKICTKSQVSISMCNSHPNAAYLLCKFVCKADIVRLKLLFSGGVHIGEHDSAEGVAQRCERAVIDPARKNGTKCVRTRKFGIEQRV